MRDAAVVFTGDLCFAGGTPIVWAGPLSGAGPLSRWLQACRRIVGLSPQRIVPGHGPVTTTAALDETVAYLEHVEREATERLHAGMGVLATARDIPPAGFDRWHDPERIVANVATVHRHLGFPEPRGVAEVLAGMAEYWAGQL